MATLLEFGRKGGTITTGDDAGFLWGSMYGFGISRELELQQEAGFAAARSHRARDCERREGARHAGPPRPRPPGHRRRSARRQRQSAREPAAAESVRHRLDDLQRAGHQQHVGDGEAGDTNVKMVHGGGIEWTIKDGIPYHVPTLMKEVKDMVAKARSERGRSTSQP